MRELKVALNLILSNQLNCIFILFFETCFIANFLALRLPNNPNIFVHLLKTTADEMKCVLLPIVSANQIPKEDSGWNYAHFLPLQARLKHYYYPMMTRFDFKGLKSMNAGDLENMQLMKNYIANKSGQPNEIQFFINKCKDERMDLCLIYYNSGVFQNLPDEQVFSDLADEEYHVMGHHWWQMWTNVVWDEPRLINEAYIIFMEPITIKNRPKLFPLKNSKADQEFITSCQFPKQWTDEMIQMICNKPGEATCIHGKEALARWKSIQLERQRLARVPLKDSFLKWKCTKPMSVTDKLQLFINEIEKIECQTEDRISFNSKVINREKQLQQQATDALRKLSDLQLEKDFYNLNMIDNDKLMNEYYLPQLHAAISMTKKKGMNITEVSDQASQCDESVEDSFQDWSGQWSPLEEDITED